MQSEEKEEIFQGYLTEEEKQEIYKEGKKEGRIEGIEEGKKEGRIEGIEEGRIEGIEEGQEELREKIVKNLIKQGDSPEKIAEATNMSIAEINALTQQ